jgi:erythromycin esterase
LEADYGACSKINRLIHGADDNPELALIEVKLWPWQTKELLELVIWMRDYNKIIILWNLSVVTCNY